MELQDYRDRIEPALRDFVSQGQSILQFELTDFRIEDGVIVAVYEVWLGDSSCGSQFGTIVHESAYFMFEVENISPEKALVYSHWNDAFSSETSVLDGDVPGEVLDAWIDLNTESIYCHFDVCREELASCPPVIASAFWGEVKEREAARIKAEFTESVSGAKQNGRLATGMFSAGF